MKYFKTVAFISALIFLQSCKTAQPLNFLDGNNFLVSEHYYVIDYNLPDKKEYTEREVKQKDSIASIKNEFQKLISELREENIDSEIDTISEYKLKFISNNHKSENIGRPSTETHLLKKCDQYVNLKYFIKTLEFTTSYSKKYLVVSSIPTIEHGNTYVRSSDKQYYFEKIEAER